jgi:hypothetical protein
VDSGVTDHFINDDRHFFSEITLRNPIKISVAKTGETLESTKIENIGAITSVNEKEKM